MKRKTEISKWIKIQARELGFEVCGIAKAKFLEKEAPVFEKWLRAGMHGKMTYMENHFEKRLDPRKLMEGAKTVIVFLYNYFPEKILQENSNYILSKYAYGMDYHYVIKNKLKALIALMKENIGAINARAFVDSAPVAERAWAVRAGIGWIGKNSNVILPKAGSFYFISEIITDLELEYDQPNNNNMCGSCRKCIDTCPTKAIVAPGVIDAQKCISYLTIEYGEQIPVEYKEKLNDRIFGCDICQDVCPWNRFSHAHHEPDFHPHPEIEKMIKDDWHNLSEDQFKKIFRKSAVKRTNYKGLMLNICFLEE